MSLFPEQRPEDRSSQERFAERRLQADLHLGGNAAPDDSDQYTEGIQEYLNQMTGHFLQVCDPERKQTNDITVFHPNWNKEVQTKGWFIGTAITSVAPGLTYLTTEASIAAYSEKYHELAEIDLATLSEADAAALRQTITQYGMFLSQIRYSKLT